MQIFRKQTDRPTVRFWLKDKLYGQHKSLTIKCIPHSLCNMAKTERPIMTFHIKRKLILNILES